MNGTNLYTADVNAPTGFRPATLEEIMTGARQALSNRVRKGTALTSPQLTRAFLTLKLGTLEHEVFALILLDLCGVASYVVQRRFFADLTVNRVAALHIAN
jgi:hypothetical protein